MRMTVSMHGKRYAVDASQLLAHGERSPFPGEASGGGVTFLFRTADDSYFAQHRMPGGIDPHDERVWMEAVSPLDAAQLFAQLEHKTVSYEEAFP